MFCHTSSGIWYIILSSVLRSHLWCWVGFCVFFFKQKTAYEMRISDWSSDVCSSDLEFSWGCPSESVASGRIGAAGRHQHIFDDIPVTAGCASRAASAADDQLRHQFVDSLRVAFARNLDFERRRGTRHPHLHVGIKIEGSRRLE